jgi:1-acyl-sn-glycerol-3-phosphate acyltransferase
MAYQSDDQRYPPIHWLFGPMRAIILFLSRALTRLRVEGLENVPAVGQFIFVSNHLHHLDAPIIGVTLPTRRNIHALAAEKYFTHWFFGPILKITGAIFINRGEVDRKALRMAFNVLEDGGGLAIAVEGTRSKTGQLAAGKSGAAYIATRADVPLIPIAVWGSENIVKCWARLKRAVVTVRYGKPFRLPEGHARAENLIRYTNDIIMVRIALMLPEKYRGIYHDHPLVAGQASEEAPPAPSLAAP